MKIIVNVLLLGLMLVLIACDSGNVEDTQTSSMSDSSGLDAWSLDSDTHDAVAPDLSTPDDGMVQLDADNDPPQVDAATHYDGEIDGDAQVVNDLGAPIDAASPSCDDGQVNGDETDIDCGGSCERCRPERSCQSDDDCLSSRCLLGQCAPSQCGDGVLQEGEACDDGNTVTEACEYGLAECVVCAADCTTQAGAVSQCGDGVVDDAEGCDDGNTVTEACPLNEGPCQVCDAQCRHVGGEQRPAPKRWDGEAGDGRWDSVANWSPDGLPGQNEWVVIGEGATVTADRPRCRNVTIEAGATLRQSHQVLACGVTVIGTFERLGGGVNPAGRSVTLRGLFGSVPWIDTWDTQYTFYDGARFGNRDMSFRVRAGNAMRFVLSRQGFTTIQMGAALDPQSWEDVSFSVDLSAYDLANGPELVLWDFQRHDGAFDANRELPVNIEDHREMLDGRLQWDPEASRLLLRVGSRRPPQDVQAVIEPLAPTAYSAIRANATTQHPTALLRYEWFVDGEPVAGDGPDFTAVERLTRGALIRVDVYAETNGGRSGPFSDAVIVSNSPPAIERLSIIPAAPSVADDLRLEFNVRDPDAGDQAELINCIWQRWSDGWADILGGQALAGCERRAGCEAGALIRVSCQASDGTDSTSPLASEPVMIRRADCEDTAPDCVARPFVPVVHPRDFSFWYWPTKQRPRDPETWPSYQRQMHFGTGFYGMVFDEARGDLVRFGGVDDTASMDEGRLRDNSVINSLANASIRWEAGSGDHELVADAFLGDDGNADGGIARLSEGGRFMNRLDIPAVAYSGDERLRGQIEIAALPRHVVFTHRIHSFEAEEMTRTARIRLSGDAFVPRGEIAWIVQDRALRLTDQAGQSWLLAVYDRAGSVTTLRRTDQGAIVAERRADEPVTHQHISLLIARLDGLNEHEVDMLVAPDATIEVTYDLLTIGGEDVRSSRGQWDESLGAYRVGLGSLSEAGLGEGRSYDDRPELHNWYGRHRLTVNTGGRGPISVPLAFYSNQSIGLNITGGVAFWRDEDGEPIGVPVQMSKNWHDASTGQWYRLYSQPRFSGIDAAPLELTMVSSRWGRDAYAASHSQLSLIGWNNGVAHWDESALGCFGESITYNPDRTYRSMVDDVRPFLVRAQDNNRRWNWTGNVGGADFLRYYSAINERNWPREMSRVRTTYRSHGPNLTDVTYSGVTLDNKIQGDITVQMGRTDDLVRTWYHFEYTFLDDVEYDRFALFQVAADNYSDNGFTRAAWGNADGVIEDRRIDDHGTTGYAAQADRGIPLAGDAPWVMLYDNQYLDLNLPEHYADLAYVVRHFEANIGGTVIRTPHLNLHRTFNRMSQLGFELGLPFEEGAAWCGDPCQGRANFIPAGSTIQATVEYLVPPADKARYYGTSDYLQTLPANDWRTTNMIRRLASGNDLAVEVEVGQLRRSHPIELEAAPGAIAAQFTVSGGLGLVPISIHGLARHDGWILQRRQGEAWIDVDQTVHGNDFWQARYDGSAASYTLTWNVPNRTVETYRLRWRPRP